MEILSALLVVKVLIVTTFPDEAKRWIEREKLTHQYELPGHPTPLRCGDAGQCLVVTGMGTANAAAAMMAVGLHPKLELAKAYVVLAGIAGGDRASTTIGQATWAKWVVGSDDRHEMDRAELPKSFEFTSFRLGCREPWCKSEWNSGNEVFHLNEKLVDWAVKTGGGVQCDVIAGGDFFHGKTLSRWAAWWVKSWTDGKGKYCATAMEDAGLMAAVKRLAPAKRVDADRVLVLRTIANFDRPGPKQGPLDSMKVDGAELEKALEAAYVAGSKVTRVLVAGRAP